MVGYGLQLNLTKRRKDEKLETFAKRSVVIADVANHRTGRKHIHVS
jgi:hypothetical protein